jgi:hypothetical protein
MGRDFFVSMAMASIGMEMMGQSGSHAIVDRLTMLTARLADWLRGGTADVPEARVRTPHILSLGFRDGMPKGLIAKLATENIHVAPHFWPAAHQPARLQRRQRHRPVHRSVQ